MLSWLARGRRRDTALLNRVRRLHARLPDGTCTCDPYFKPWGDCPTAILLWDSANKTKAKAAR